ncbi:TPA: flagellar basal body P-ring formation chaperone FlgA [Kluyvera cryocrescens]|uniref:Flagella basal body P-ring formation protein FlgA n=1 Tax=Kluyvera cryocrescens TaxID=580 RepID=A0A2X3E8S7_KLUCR|nr:flagellar basal body P-ring formation chaperone FlgA [Kluyvera cryocrescens]MCX2865897.1 flagellar basal body P-ring formation chaperone FlgA [Kluyvera cryocrescens]MDW3779473.1 flagellar basal body P-ring formation chaperone FlgA [Kluyvera cryocrescens]MEB6632049.1 flagellar basal body P-ring formation protein FlgA [Kluyvera cryocrescens]MEB7555785.1 flagellar basal body P-ring formation chaperone FlgA [Kluyvera cryocrescens]MEB7711998.1 flagellar basal body P-ring formation chaperone FlgA
MRQLIAPFTAALLAFSPLVQAADIQTQLTDFFTQRLTGFSDEVSVSLRNAQNLKLACDEPAFNTPGNSRLWGNITVLAQCGNAKQYLQVNVQAIGEYVVAAAPIVRGSPIEAQSVTLMRGRLDQLPPRTMLTLAQAEDAISLRDVAIGQPLQLSMVRQSWRVKAGQKVVVIAQGEGFSINSEGQALNNASVAQSARVRMPSGQVVSGQVNTDGNILINL